MIRMLFTGSRNYRDRGRVWAEADALLAAHGPFVAVHGRHPKGADRYISEWVRARRAQGVPVEEEPHPADWNGPCEPTCKHGPRPVGNRGQTYCPAAGPRRNAAMVALGAQLYRAFIRHQSPGASGCAELADQAGIPGERIPDTD